MSYLFFYFDQESFSFDPHTGRHPSVTTQTSLTTGELIRTPYSPMNGEFCYREFIYFILFIYLFVKSTLTNMHDQTAISM